MPTRLIPRPTRQKGKAAFKGQPDYDEILIQNYQKSPKRQRDSSQFHRDSKSTAFFKCQSIYRTTKSESPTKTRKPVQFNETYCICSASIAIMFYEFLNVVAVTLFAWSPQIFSTNNTECSRLLEEIKCARCSPNAQMLFHLSEQESARHHEPDLPRLCLDYCQEFYYTCRGHVPGKINWRYIK